MCLLKYIVNILKFIYYTHICIFKYNIRTISIIFLYLCVHRYVNITFRVILIHFVLFLNMISEMITLYWTRIHDSSLGEANLLSFYIH